MADALTLVTMVGSLRKGSLNAGLADALPDCAPPDVTIRRLPGLGDFPLYDADLQARGFPAPVVAMGDAIRGADGVLIVSPEYNYSLPGVLKNGIDWLSRLPEQPFAKKPVAILSASPGLFGGARMQYHLRQVMVFVDAYVLPRPEVMVGQAGAKFDGEGRLTDEKTREHVAAQLGAFAAFIAKLR